MLAYTQGHGLSGVEGVGHPSGKKSFWVRKGIPSSNFANFGNDNLSMIQKSAEEWEHEKSKYTQLKIPKEECG